MPTDADIQVLSAGLYTTVQDGGRHGLYNIGIPLSGGMDDFSLRAANLLVGNAEDAAVLEVTYLGPRLRFGADRLVAVTGADLVPTVDGEDRPLWEAFVVRAGEVLGFGKFRAGVRVYVAVAGAVDVPVALGSRSTYARIGLGGHQGRTLEDGDELRVGVPTGGRAGAQVPEPLRPTLASQVEVRVLLGLFAHRLTDAGREAFLGTDWRVTNDADRVGYRYQGAELEFTERESPFGVGGAPWNVSSLNYPNGVIQVPGGVEPIVLMRDGVTGGNFATVGTVISADRDLVGQTKAPDVTRFRPVSMDEALGARAERRRRLQTVREQLGDL